MPRELILLQGKGCFWHKCTFCDYYQDSTSEPFKTNAPIIDMITGFNGVVDVINSGSAMELDAQSITKLFQKFCDVNCKTVWFEAHYLYKNHLNPFAENFPNMDVKFRTGIETFNINLRKIWAKGIPENVTPEMISQYFKGICLLVGVEGQTLSDILQDIEIAEKYFDYYSVNVFTENSTKIKPDKKLISKFIEHVYSELKHSHKAEILLDNTDLGVG